MSPHTTCPAGSVRPLDYVAALLLIAWPFWLLFHGTPTEAGLSVLIPLAYFTGRSVGHVIPHDPDR